MVFKKKKTKTLYSHLTGSRKKLQPDKQNLKKKKERKEKVHLTSYLMMKNQIPSSNMRSKTEISTLTTPIHNHNGYDNDSSILHNQVS